jgi:Flp pilus assembly protein TadD
MYEAQNAYQRLRSTLSTAPDAAMVEIKTFLKIFPDVAQAHNDLGVLCHTAGDTLHALAHYEKANRLQPNTPTIIKNLAEFYCVVLGWTDDAIEMLTSLLVVYPDDFEILTALGEISGRVGRPDEARAFFRKALQIDPDNQELRERMAQLDGPVSAAEYRVPVASVEQLSAQQDTITDEYTESASSFERMLSLNPQNGLAHNNLGIIWMKRGDITKASSHYEQAVKCEPDNSTYRKNLADLYYTHLGKTDEAIEIYTGLLKAHPKDTELLTSLAIIAQANQLKEQARTFIRRVLELEPWNTDAREFLAGL